MISANLYVALTKIFYKTLGNTQKKKEESARSHLSRMSALHFETILSKNRAYDVYRSLLCSTEHMSIRETTVSSDPNGIVSDNNNIVCPICGKIKENQQGKGTTIHMIAIRGIRKNDSKCLYVCFATTPLFRNSNHRRKRETSVRSDRWAYIIQHSNRDELYEMMRIFSVHSRIIYTLHRALFDIPLLEYLPSIIHVKNSIRSIRYVSEDVSFGDVRDWLYKLDVAHGWWRGRAEEALNAMINSISINSSIDDADGGGGDNVKGRDYNRSRSGICKWMSSRVPQYNAEKLLDPKHLYDNRNKINLSKNGKRGLRLMHLANIIFILRRLFEINSKS